ncbi:prenyltransferase/squalene oxidase repeat-containing protein [Paenibacillus humicola]|uniref:terpene cyclase/mutase family protein n=1 Tax=Paenibacillus humicola TaxID=3110540 RepID=UPI00237AB396|nr:prenyltransferase/squalene oxidase repeat-containing protein [Paenibacillus humicola]
MTGRLNDGIAFLTRRLLTLQSADGSWRLGFFEEGSTTDAAVVLLFTAVFPERAGTVRRLCERIAANQRPEGWWTVYPDEPGGHASATAENYYALLAAGYDSGSVVRRAGEAFAELGGRKRIDSLMTKFLLAVNGRYPWPKWFPVPITLLLLPVSSPVHFHLFSGYARVHMAPMLLLGDCKPVFGPERFPAEAAFSRPPGGDPAFRADAEWARHFDRRLMAGGSLPHPGGIGRGAQAFRPEDDAGGQMQHPPGRLTGRLRRQAAERAVRYMLDRLEPSGTLYSYTTATVLMVYALLSAGFSPKHPVIANAAAGLESFLITDRNNGQTTLQNATSTVWDTALISHALQKAGLPAAHPAIQGAGRYLLARQHTRTGDWKLQAPGAVPGGWGFSDCNTINPDVDDTSAALRAIAGLRGSPAGEEAHNRGLQWLLALQNDDGGWGAFERNCDSPLVKWLPLDGAGDAAADPSSADLTGRALEYLGGTAGLTVRLPFIRRAADWLYLNQEPNGSWYGRWGVCYLYGTWAALTGLIAVGENPRHPQIRKAAEWLRYIQHDDGGFGESCVSDRVKRFVQLPLSTVTQTAWALDALVAVQDRPDESARKAADYLLRNVGTDGPAARYPTGGALPGQMYTRYESYPLVWPLLALAHYRSKYGV